ncbi:glycoside hydrolase family 43 protein [Gorillibacterium sp. sgz5001074]|uniref:glycoside hydrolase family 43 protein n=1 Tax=Gorillibacterium sp. sgz5001074 TaxID=3446695 RepID=UPI003F66D5DA
MNTEQAENKKHVWCADLGNGRYKNPVLYADYSDPDVVSHGGYFYMTASSFTSVPGLPILRSGDLVNWELIGHAVERLPERYDGRVLHGCGVWAPSIRHHAGRFWIYFGDPDIGIFMCSAEDPAGPWSPLHLVKEAKGWIDPCPLWDEDGQAYLVHAFAKSRSGIKHKLQVCRMSPDGRSLLDNGTLVFDGTESHPTLEGPKLYKRNGYYYIFAPAGGVPTGWQAIFRSRSVFGPYEDRIVLHQGDTPVNGPHQGGYVELESGESWFLHFQDRDAYGRIVHLQPMRWENDWPVMGEDRNGDGIGEPVLEWSKPNVGREWPVAVPATGDEFEGAVLGLQWQWQSNWKRDWYSLEERPGHLRLYARPHPEGVDGTLYRLPQLLCQKLPAPVFTAAAKLELSGGPGVRAGLCMFGHRYAFAACEADGPDGAKLVFALGDGTGEAPVETVREVVRLDGIGTDRCVHLMVRVEEGALCTFFYSVDGTAFQPVGAPFTAEVGGWTGAKLGLFCLPSADGAPGGWADFDSFRIY